jgi:DedD protein
MNEKHELNDIILNKGGATNSNKKIILAVATLGVVLIIVVILMNSLSSSGTDNLPQAVLPPEPQSVAKNSVAEEPLFEDVEVIQDKDSSDADLDMIAQKLKKESFEEDVTVKEPVVEKPKEKVVVKEKVSVKTTHKQSTHKKATNPKYITKGSFYIQVGSFSRYEPNKKFLGSITKLGYHYRYHKVGSRNKVLVGPFKTSNEAKKARRTLRSKVEPGAFLVKI